LLTALSVVSPELRPETDLPHRFEHCIIFVAAGTAFGFPMAEGFRRLLSRSSSLPQRSKSLGTLRLAAMRV
jgi:hypothetical protein